MIPDLRPGFGGGKSVHGAEPEGVDSPFVHGHRPHDVGVDPGFELQGFLPGEAGMRLAPFQGGKAVVSLEVGFQELEKNPGKGGGTENRGQEGNPEKEVGGDFLDVARVQAGHLGGFDIGLQVEIGRAHV